MPNLWNKCSYPPRPPAFFLMKKRRLAEENKVSYPKLTLLGRVLPEPVLPSISDPLSLSLELVETLEMIRCDLCSFLRWGNREGFGSAVYGWWTKSSCPVLLCFLTSHGLEISRFSYEGQFVVEEADILFFLFITFLGAKSITQGSKAHERCTIAATAGFFFVL